APQRKRPCRSCALPVDHAPFSFAVECNPHHDNHTLTKGAHMTSQSLRNDAEHWRTRAEEVRMLASEEKDTPTKDALLRVADDYARRAHWVGGWALRLL